MGQNRLAAIAVTVFMLAGCRTVMQNGEGLLPAAPEPLPPLRSLKLSVALPDGSKTSLNADYWRPIKWAHPTVVVVRVPGGGASTRKGTQEGNGAQAYSAPIDVYSLWADAIARQGYAVLTYDKRTTGSLSDIDTEGPAAYRRDVDAACELASREAGIGAKIVLWTDTQGTQVVLSSKCAQKASALVFVAPVSDRIDRFWVDGLFHASRVAPEPGVRSSQAQRARNLRATFESMEKGHFEADSKIMGMTLAYWKGWIDLTRKTPSLVKKLRVPMLFFVGQHDELAPEHAKPPFKVKILPGADNNLLTEGVLARETSDAALAALASLLKGD